MQHYDELENMSDYEFARSLVVEQKNKIIENKTSRPIVYEGDAKINFEVEVEVGVIRYALTQHDTWAQVVMRAMWNLVNRWDGAWQLRYQVNDLRGLLYKIKADADNLEYVPHIVERILPYADRLDNPLKPGEKLTADILIDTPGLARKLKAASPHFRDAVNAEDEERQQEIADLVMTQSAKTVEATVRSFDKPDIKIKYEVRQSDSEYFVNLLPMTKEEFQTFRSLLGVIGEEV